MWVQHLIKGTWHCPLKKLHTVLICLSHTRSWKNRRKKNSIRKTERRVEDKEKKDKRRTDKHKWTCMCLFNMLLANHFYHSNELSVIERTVKKLRVTCIQIHKIQVHVANHHSSWTLVLQTQQRCHIMQWSVCMSITSCFTNTQKNSNFPTFQHTWVQ